MKNKRSNERTVRKLAVRSFLARGTLPTRQAVVVALEERTGEGVLRLADLLPPLKRFLFEIRHPVGKINVRTQDRVGFLGGITR